MGLGLVAWIGLILVVDGALAFALRRPLGEWLPGWNVRVLALAELAIGLALLAARIVAGRPL